MDRRVKKTKSAIKQSFIKMAKNKDINKIKVSELAELADINRKTFYLHYVDIFAVKEEIQEEFIKQTDFLSNQISLVVYNHDLKSFVSNLFDLLELASEEFYEILDTDLYSSLINTAKKEFKKSLLKEYIKLGGKNVEFFSYMFTFYASGTLDLFEDWYKHKDIVSRDEVIELVCKLVVEGEQIIDIDI
jgi:AcrR family transcriptional regulator